MAEGECPGGPSRSPGGPGLPCAQVNCLFVSRATGTIYVGTKFGLGRSEDGGKSFSYLRGAEWEQRLKGEFGSPAARLSTPRPFSPRRRHLCPGRRHVRPPLRGSKKGRSRRHRPARWEEHRATPCGLRLGLLPVPGGMLIGRYGGGIAFHPTSEEKTTAPMPVDVKPPASPATFPRLGRRSHRSRVAYAGRRA